MCMPIFVIDLIFTVCNNFSYAVLFISCIVFCCIVLLFLAATLWRKWRLPKELKHGDWSWKELSWTDERSKDEDDDEDSSEDSFAVEVAVSDSRHGDNGEVRPVPVVVFRLIVAEICPRVTAQLRLKHKIN